jgi:preprotein translocase subunit SecB
MNTKDIELIFSGYEIVKSNMSKVEEIPSDSNGSEIGIMYKIIPNKTKGFNKANVIQGISIHASETFSYDLEVILRGDFGIRNCDDEKKVKFLIENASAIMYPYLRSYVSMITSQLNYDKIMLPVMNFHKLIKDQDINDLMLNPTNFKDFTIE